MQAGKDSSRGSRLSPTSEAGAAVRLRGCVGFVKWLEEKEVHQAGSCQSNRLCSVQPWTRDLVGDVMQGSAGGQGQRQLAQPNLSK